MGGTILIFIIIFLLMFGLPIDFIIRGRKSKENKKRAMWFYIIAVVYLIVGLGICGTLLDLF